MDHGDQSGECGTVDDRTPGRLELEELLGGFVGSPGAENELLEVGEALKEGIEELESGGVLWKLEISSASLAEKERRNGPCC